MDLDYICDKLFIAIESLATGKDSIQQRLFDACFPDILLFRVDYFPANLQQRWEDIKAGIIWKPAKGDEGSLQATIFAMSEDEAVSIAKKICAFYELLEDQKDHPEDKWD